MSTLQTLDRGLRALDIVAQSPTGISVADLSRESDRVGRRIAMLVPAVVLVVWAPVFFWLVQQQSLTLL